MEAKEYYELEEVDMLLQLVQERLSSLGEEHSIDTEEIAEIVAHAILKIREIM